MRHHVVMVVTMTAGEQVQIVCKNQPLFPLESVKQAWAGSRFLRFGPLALFFDLADLIAQPASERFFQLQLGSAAIEIIGCLTLRSQRNEPARRNLVF